MCMHAAPWPEPDPQVAAAIEAMYGTRKTPRPLAVLIRDRLGQWLRERGFPPPVRRRGGAGRRRRGEGGGRRGGGGPPRPRAGRRGGGARPVPPAATAPR